MRRFFRTKTQEERKARLAVERKLLSAEFDGLQPTPGHIQRHCESWVRMWVDMSYAVFSDCGDMYARRGLTDDGQMIWLVKHIQRPLAFHAAGHDPAKAFQRAEDAWRRCDEMRGRQSEARRLIRDLILGRERFDVSVVDAADSPLSAVEVRGFLSRMGLSRRHRVSGRLAALMSLIEPQMGMVILIAHQRRRPRRVQAMAGQGAIAA